MTEQPTTTQTPARVPVRALADLPAAFGRLARMVAVADHLKPGTVGRLAAEHAHTLLTLAGVIERRDTVPGSTAPALLGVATELRAHAGTLSTVRSAVRNMRSTAADDPGPARQQAEIRQQVRRDSRRLHHALTDADLHTVIACLRPALRLAPALCHAVDRQVHSGGWLQPAAEPTARWSRTDQAPSPPVSDAARTASDSAARLTVWLPKPPPAAYRRPPRDVLDPRIQRRDRAAGHSSDPAGPARTVPM